jgi:hypothetical protein
MWVLMTFTGWFLSTPGVRVTAAAVAAAATVAVGTSGVEDKVGPGVGGMVTTMGDMAATGVVAAGVGGLLTTVIFKVPQERISRAEMTIKIIWDHFLDMQ